MLTLIRYLFIIGFLFVLTILWANYRISSTTSQFIYSDTTSLPACKTAILLGTSKRISKGVPNDYFYNRITATVTLFNSGKIKYIIISGDNSVDYYNEPMDMKKELIKAGIPDSVIFMDYAGLRTFDSMIRAKEIFGQKKFIVVSQKFHNEREVFIARRYEIEAYGYNAEDVSTAKGLKTRFRELFARVKVFIDIYSGKQPKFLGDKVVIP